jgi:hypothetical protein
MHRMQGTAVGLIVSPFRLNVMIQVPDRKLGPKCQQSVMPTLIFGDFLQGLVTKRVYIKEHAADLHSGPASPIFTADDVNVDLLSPFEEGGAEHEFR